MKDSSKQEQSQELTEDELKSISGGQSMRNSPIARNQFKSMVVDRAMIKGGAVT